MHIFLENCPFCVYLQHFKCKAYMQFLIFNLFQFYVSPSSRGYLVAVGFLCHAGCRLNICVLSELFKSNPYCDVFGRWLGLEIGACMNKISVLRKGTTFAQTRELSHPLHHVRFRWKDGICEPGNRFSPDTVSVDTLILEFWPPEMRQINVSCLNPSPPHITHRQSEAFLLQQLQGTKTVYLCS